MMDAREEMLTLLQKLWAKLQGLPTASPLEIGAFAVLIIFIVVFLLMLLMTCLTCCCCHRTRTKGPHSQLT
uniref:Small integral membrane protein 5 n=1 Tax=Salmo trutta TaxID=8032 RepID=A0A673Z7P6_SALTR